MSARTELTELSGTSNEFAPNLTEVSGTGIEAVPKIFRSTKCLHAALMNFSYLYHPQTGGGNVKVNSSAAAIPRK